jgi:hypothetical protein
VALNSSLPQRIYMQTRKPILFIYGIIALLTIFVSALGLFSHDLYFFRSNDMTTFEIAGQDIISFLISVIFLFTIIFYKYPLFSKIIIPGILVYCSYTYSYYLFGMLSNKYYLVYFLIVSLSFYSLLLFFYTIAHFDKYIEQNYHRKILSFYIVFIILIVAFIDFKDVFYNTVIQNHSISTKGSFYILDLVFLFPGMIISAILNLKRKYLGFVFLGIFLIKTISLMPALILSDILHFINLGTFVDFTFDIIAFTIMLSSVVVFIIYLMDVKKTKLLV